MIMAGACGSRGKTVELSCVERVRAFALGRPRASQWSDGREQGEVESRLTLHSTAFYLSRASLLYKCYSYIASMSPLRNRLALRRVMTEMCELCTLCRRPVR